MEKFKNIHPNQDIYIIGSGKSLDFLDKSFFDNKITIGINQSYKYIEPKYLVRKEHQFIDMVLKETSEKVTHFVSRGDCGSKNHLKQDLQIKYDKIKNIVFFDHNINVLDIHSLPKENQLIVSFSTITSGIHLAAHMGAKNIILVGHDCGSINNQCTFNNYHSKTTMKQNNVNEYREWLTNIEVQTIDLKRMLKEKYNCNVVSLNPFINFNLEGNKYCK